MKRRELKKRFAQIAAAHGVRAECTEGGSHTKVRVGEKQAAIPRHTEINEITARAILKHLEG